LSTFIALNSGSAMGVVTGLRLPTRILAAADVDPDRHLRRRAGNDRIDDADIGVQQVTPVVAALRQQLPHARIAELD
jgi:hypothetical protein